MADRKIGIYRVYDNGERELIGRVTSALEAIDVAGEHLGEIEGTTITIGSEPEETEQ